jgi:predicted metal-dependent peptidase
MARPSKKLSAIKKYVDINKEEVETNKRIGALKQALRQMQRMSVFPGIRQVNRFTIVYGVDTSGSMGTKEIQMGLAELQHVQKSDSEVNVCVMYSDTDIGKEYWIGPNDEIDPKVTGRGGTDFDPIFTRVAELLRSAEKAPDILVYCTDGYAPPPTIKLPIPVVWLLTPRGQPVCRDAGHITIEMRDYQLGESY